MAGEVEHVLVEAHVIAVPLEHDGLEVVVENGPWNPQRLECVDVAAQKALERLVEREARVHRARPRQHEDEARQRPERAPDADLTEMPPVDLRLLAGQRLEAQVRLGFGARAY